MRRKYQDNQFGRQGEQFISEEVIFGYVQQCRRRRSLFLSQRRRNVEKNELLNQYQYNSIDGLEISPVEV